MELLKSAIVIFVRSLSEVIGWFHIIEVIVERMHGAYQSFISLIKRCQSDYIYSGWMLKISYIV